MYFITDSMINKLRKTLLSFFKRVGENQSSTKSLSPCQVNAQDSSEQHASKFQRVEVEETRNTYLERDPGLRHQIGTYSVNQRDDIRREYIKMGPYQPKLRDYPLTNDGMQERRFHCHWFKKFPWLEYSEVKDSAFCFPCFLFDEIPSNNPKFVIEGFSSWKRVNNGKKCPFLQHEGGPSSHHNKNMQSWGCLRNPI